MLGWLGALALFCFCELIAYLTITSFSALISNTAACAAAAPTI